MHRTFIPVYFIDIEIVQMLIFLKWERFDLFRILEFRMKEFASTVKSRVNLDTYKDTC